MLPPAHLHKPLLVPFGGGALLCLLLSIRDSSHDMAGCSGACCTSWRPPWLVQNSIPSLDDEVCVPAENSISSYHPYQLQATVSVAAGVADNAASGTHREATPKASIHAATTIAAAIRGFKCRRALQWMLPRDRAGEGHGDNIADGAHEQSFSYAKMVRDGRLRQADARKAQFRH